MNFVYLYQKTHTCAIKEWAIYSNYMRIRLRARFLCIAGLFILLAAGTELAAETPSGNAIAGKPGTELGTDTAQASAGTELDLELHGGFGYEDRGVAGQAETIYAGGRMGTELVTIRTAFSFDIRSVQLGREKYFDFRSWMIEAGTGSSTQEPFVHSGPFGPFDFRFRYQTERFSRSNTSLQSVIPFVTFDSRYFFCALGYNFRTFSMDDGNPARPFFSIEEKEIACAVGVRVWPMKNLSASLALRNYDDYSAGNFASLGYEATVSAFVSGYEFKAIAGWRPSGATAYAATPMGAVFRLCAGMKL